jgi:hypothetical protein
MIAAGYDLPYVQAQVGHLDPTVTLAVYAHVMRRPDREQLKAEIRAVLGVAPAPSDAELRDHSRTRDTRQSEPDVGRRRGNEKAGNGRGVER